MRKLKKDNNDAAQVISNLSRTKGAIIKRPPYGKSVTLDLPARSEGNTTPRFDVSKTENGAGIPRFFGKIRIDSGRVAYHYPRTFGFSTSRARGTGMPAANIALSNSLNSETLIPGAKRKCGILNRNQEGVNLDYNEKDINHFYGDCIFAVCKIASEGELTKEYLSFANAYNALERELKQLKENSEKGYKTAAAQYPKHYLNFAATNPRAAKDSLNLSAVDSAQNAQKYISGDIVFAQRSGAENNADADVRLHKIIYNNKLVFSSLSGIYTADTILNQPENATKNGTGNTWLYTTDSEGYRNASTIFPTQAAKPCQTANCRWHVNNYSDAFFNPSSNSLHILKPWLGDYGANYEESLQNAQIFGKLSVFCDYNHVTNEYTWKAFQGAESVFFYNGKSRNHVFSTFASKQLSGDQTLPSPQSPFIGLSLADFCVGNSGDLSSFSVELSHTCKCAWLGDYAGKLDDEVNPISALVTVLTDEDFGAAFKLSQLDNYTFIKAWELCGQENLGFSYIFKEDGESLADAVSVILEHVGALMYVDPNHGRICIAPLRNYNEKTKLLELNSENISSVESVSLEGDLLSLPTHADVIFSNRRYKGASYALGNSPEAYSTSSLRLAGPRAGQTGVAKNLLEIPLETTQNATTAAKIGQRILAENSQQLLTANITVSRGAKKGQSVLALRPGDFVLLTLPRYGIPEKTRFRVLSVGLGEIEDNSISLFLSRDAFVSTDVRVSIPESPIDVTPPLVPEKAVTIPSTCRLWSAPYFLAKKGIAGDARKELTTYKCSKISVETIAGKRSLIPEVSGENYDRFTALAERPLDAESGYFSAQIYGGNNENYSIEYCKYTVRAQSTGAGSVLSSLANIHAAEKNGGFSTASFVMTFRGEGERDIVFDNIINANGDSAATWAGKKIPFNHPNIILATRTTAIVDTPQILQEELIFLNRVTKTGANSITVNSYHRFLYDSATPVNMSGVLDFWFVGQNYDGLQCSQPILSNRADPFQEVKLSQITPNNLAVAFSNAETAKYHADFLPIGSRLFGAVFQSAETGNVINEQVTRGQFWQILDRANRLLPLRYIQWQTGIAANSLCRTWAMPNNRKKTDAGYLWPSATSESGLFFSRDYWETVDTGALSAGAYSLAITQRRDADFLELYYPSLPESKTEEEYILRTRKEELEDVLGFPEPSAYKDIVTPYREWDSGAKRANVLYNIAPLGHIYNSTFSYKLWSNNAINPGDPSGGGTYAQIHAAGLARISTDNNKSATSPVLTNANVQYYVHANSYRFSAGGYFTGGQELWDYTALQTSNSRLIQFES